MRLMNHPNICAIKAYFYSQGENKVNKCVGISSKVLIVVTKCPSFFFLSHSLSLSFFFLPLICTFLVHTCAA